MKSKTSLFNRTIVLNLLQRYWIAFVAYLCVYGAIVLIPLINALQELAWYATNIPYYASLYQLMGIAPTSTIFTNFCAVAVAAALLFSYLYNPRHTGMMASLPVKRETMYLSVCAAAIAGMIVCNIVILTLALVVEIIYGQVHLGALGLLFLISAGSILAFFGLAAFCCMLTGNIFAGPAVYGIFNVLTVGTEALLYELLPKIMYGLNPAYSPATTFLSPIFQVGQSVNFDHHQIHDAAGNWVDYTWEMEGLGVLAIYAVVGLVFLVLGMLLYKNRRMETAGDTISIEILKPVFRLCCTVGGGMLFAVFVSGLLYQITPTGAMAAAYIAVLVIIGGILGYFISRMLISKTVNVFRKGWKTVGIYALCVIALTAALETDLFGFERRVPVLEDVKEVTVNGFDGNTVCFDEKDNIETILALHQSIIENKDFHELENGSPDAVVYMAQFSEPNAAFSKRTIRLTYTLQNDETVTRRYAISYGPAEIRDMGSDIRVLEALMNTEEGIEERCIVDYPVTADNTQHASIEYVDADTYEYLHFGDFSPSEIARFYNECILPDIKDGTLGIIDFIEDRDYAMSKYNCTIAVEVYKDTILSRYGGTTYTEYKSIVVYPTPESERTMAFLKEYGIEPAMVYDSMLDDGYDYNDLGRYKLDGEDNGEILYDEKTGEIIEIRSAPAYVGTGVIGGADGPTSIVVTGN